MPSRLLKTSLVICASCFFVGEVVSAASRSFHLARARSALEMTLCYPNPPHLAWLPPDRLRVVPIPPDYRSTAITRGPLGSFCRRSTLHVQPESSHLPQPPQNGVASVRTSLVLPFALVIDSDGASVFSSRHSGYGREVCCRDLLLVVGSWSFTLGSWHTGASFHGVSPLPGQSAPAA